MLKIKLFAFAAFLAFASCTFLFSSGKTQAQSSKTDEKRDEILGKVAAYKLWQQVQKPEKKDEDAVKSEVLTIDNSAAMG